MTDKNKLDFLLYHLLEEVIINAGFFLGVSVSVHVQGTTEAITGLSVCTSILEKLISFSILFLSDPSRSVADAPPAGAECLVTVLVGCVAPVL